MLDDAERRQRQHDIEAVAERLELLAAQTLAGDKTNYQQFEKLHGALVRLGFATDRTQISEVARTFFEGQPKVRLIFMRPGRLDNAITWSKAQRRGRVRQAELLGRVQICRGPDLRLRDSSRPGGKLPLKKTSIRRASSPPARSIPGRRLIEPLRRSKSDYPSLLFWINTARYDSRRMLAIAPQNEVMWLSWGSLSTAGSSAKSSVMRTS
jgi:hypothetical protein